MTQCELLLLGGTPASLQNGYFGLDGELQIEIPAGTINESGRSGGNSGDWRGTGPF